MDTKVKIREELKDRMTKCMDMKWYPSITVEMVKINHEGEEVNMETIFRRETEALLTMMNFNEQFNDQINFFNAAH